MSATVSRERHVQGSEHQRLQHDAHHKEADRSPQHLGYEEEPRPCTVGGQSETTFQVTIDADKVHLVKQRYQYECHEDRAYKEAQHHLHVGISARQDGARYGNEGHARDGSSNTMYQDDLRLPVKKPALSALRPVIQEMMNSSAK